MEILFSDICTIRLDFCAFTTAGPTGTTDGSTPSSDTTMDTFAITTSPTQYPIPNIAGINTGEHGMQRYLISKCFVKSYSNVFYEDQIIL